MSHPYNQLRQLHWIWERNCIVATIHTMSKTNLDWFIYLSKPAHAVLQAEVTWVQTWWCKNGLRWWGDCNSSSRCRRGNNERHISDPTGWWDHIDNRQLNQPRSKNMWVVFQNYLSITAPVQTGSFESKQSSSTRSPQLPDICSVHLWEGVRCIGKELRQPKVVSRDCQKKSIF